MKQKQMKLWTMALMAVLLISVLTVPIFAETNDPIEVVNNLNGIVCFCKDRNGQKQTIPLRWSTISRTLCSGL